VTSFADFRAKLSESRAVILVELALVAALFVADWYHWVFFSKTPYLLVLASLSIWLRGARWRDLGFRVPEAWPRLLIAGIALGLAMEALELFVTQPVLVAITGREPDLSDAAQLASSWKMLLLAIAFSWTFAAFGEELAWRGWFLNRLFDLFGNSSAARAAAILVMAACFGLAHFDQGITGIAENLIAGLILGGAYLASGRKLMVPIVAHGIVDTIDFCLIATGHYPGL
jgi:uncharacterized protein